MSIGAKGDCGAVRCLINGSFTTTVDAADRGLAYGDGLFETLSIRDGAPCLWLAHLDRLALGALRLRLPLPSPRLLRRETQRVLAGVDTGVLKIIITRGVSGRGYLPPPDPDPTRILRCWPSDALPHERWREGLVVRLCASRLALNPQLAQIKHLNRLEQVMARSEWRDPLIGEGLMRDVEGNLVCGTMSNLFLVEDAGLATPVIDRCGVKGTVRARMLQRAHAMGIPVREARLKVADLLRAKGAMLTNALIGVQPVRRFEDRSFALDALPWSLIEDVRRDAFHPEADS